MGTLQRVPYVATLALLVLLQFTKPCVSWSLDGHGIICDLARPLLTPKAMDQVTTLMNSDFQHNFSTLCTWGEEVQFMPHYSWSPPLHTISTPDRLCSYNYSRDCVGAFGEPDYCASGAIKNYTSQLMDAKSPHNRTEAMLFLTNIIGDIHQPLRCGFAGDGSGSFISLWWLNTQNGSRSDLFSVWDSVMIHETYERHFNESNPFYNETIVDILGNMSLNIYATISPANIAAWSPCPAGPPSCPDLYAEESIQLACQHAYPNVAANQILDEAYFSSKWPVVQLRLQQSAVRVAATLNRIFDPSYVSPPLAPSPGSSPGTTPTGT